MELKPLFRDIADAIREKDASAEPIPASSFPARIRAIPSAPVAVPYKEVNFYDYDGTLVCSYTLTEARELTALPDGPKHDGLVFQGWNWMLEKIKALTRPMNVGAMYITDDGKTRLKIRVWDKARSNVPLYFSQTVSNGVAIDWGDGSAPETLDGTGNVSTSHQYAAAGEYTIALAVADGCTLGLGNGSPSYCVLGSIGNPGRVYCNLLQEVHIGDRVTSVDVCAFRLCCSLNIITIPNGVARIGNSAFNTCYSLLIVIIPDSVTSIGNFVFNDCFTIENVAIPEGIAIIYDGTFRGCYTLTNVTIPDSVTSIRDSAFRLCSSLSNARIPNGVPSIGGYTFDGCYALANVTIPESVKSIGAAAFNACYGVAEYHLEASTPPTLANVNAFNGIASDCVIYVPAGSLEAYKATENWSAYADHIREE